MIWARVFIRADDEAAGERVCRRFVDRYVRPACERTAVHVRSCGRYYKIPELFEFMLSIPIVDVGLADDAIPRLQANIGTGWVHDVCATNAGGAIFCPDVTWVNIGSLGEPA